MARSYYAVVRSSWKVVGDVICFHDKTFRSYLDSVVNLHGVQVGLCTAQVTQECMVGSGEALCQEIWVGPGSKDNMQIVPRRLR